MDIERALLDWWLTRARTVERTWFGAGQAALFAQLELELPLLDALIGAADERPDAERDEAILEILTGLWAFWTATARIRESRVRLERVLQRLENRRRGDPGLRFDAYWVLAWLALGADDVAAADPAIAQCVSLLPAVASSGARARVDQICGIRALYAGDFEGARDALSDALRRQADSGDDAQLFIDLSFLAAVISIQGDQRLAFEYCEQAVALCEDRGEQWIKCYVIWAFALGAWRDDDRHRAYVLALDGAAAAATLGDKHAGAICLEIAGWYHLTAGDARTGARLVGVAEALLEHTDVPMFFWDTAELHEAAVSTGIERVSAEAYAAEVAVGRRYSLGEAMRWLAEQLPEDRGDEVELTPRQKEIAELIAEGKSNKEIARLLLITVRTVETHIEHMFVKLGAVSRVQIAVWSLSNR